MNTGTEKIYYEFINSRTGYVIGYHSVPTEMTETERNRSLEHEKARIAVENKLLISTIYYREQNYTAAE